MEVNELRIGNLVNIPESVRKDFWDCTEFSIIGDNFKISVITNEEVNILIHGSEEEFAIKEIEPIPLTEKILVKCGFEQIDHIDGYSFWSMKRKRNSKKPAICIYDNYTTVGNNTRVKHCEFVHQFQNLYFVLTGEELKTK